MTTIYVPPSLTLTPMPTDAESAILVTVANLLMGSTIARTEYASLIECVANLMRVLADARTPGFATELLRALVVELSADKSG